MGLDALDIWYEDELALAPLVELVFGPQVELPRGEFERTTVVREADDGRSFLEQTDSFRLRMKGWKYDCGYIEHDGLPVGLLFSARFCDLLRQHRANVSFRNVIDMRTDTASPDFFQGDVNTKLPVNESHARMIRESQPHGDKRLYPGIFMNFYDDVRDRDLYFRREHYRGDAIFLTEQHLGVGKWLNDARRCLVVSNALFRDIDRLRLTGMACSPAYLVDERLPPEIWGGTMVFGQEEFLDGTYADWLEAKVKALEAVLGPADKEMYSARVPLHLGGESSVFIFRVYPAGSGGIAYVTSDLIGNRNQRPNRLGQYELMMCLRRESAEAADLLGRLAKYTLTEVLEPGETMDIAPAMPEGSTIDALLFIEPEVAGGWDAFQVRGCKSGVLLCLGITAKELAACRKYGSATVTQRLKAAGVFPFTEFSRADVDLAKLRKP